MYNVNSVEIRRKQSDSNPQLSHTVSSNTLQIWPDDFVFILCIFRKGYKKQASENIKRICVVASTRVRNIHLISHKDNNVTDLSRLCDEIENEIFFYNALKDKLTALIPNAAFKLIKNKTSGPPVSDTVNLILKALLLTLAHQG
jgi:hypothetical protein